MLPGQLKATSMKAKPRKASLMTLYFCTMALNPNQTFKEKFDRIDAESMTTEELFAENGTTEKEYLDKAMKQVHKLIHSRPL